MNEEQHIEPQFVTQRSAKQRMEKLKKLHRIRCSQENIARIVKETAPDNPRQHRWFTSFYGVTDYPPWREMVRIVDAGNFDQEAVVAMKAYQKEHGARKVDLSLNETDLPKILPPSERKAR